MPGQMLPGVAIIVAMLAAAGGIVGGAYRLGNGEWKAVGKTKFDFSMDCRDKRLKAQRKAMEEEGKKDES